MSTCERTILILNGTPQNHHKTQTIRSHPPLPSQKHFDARTLFGSEQPWFLPGLRTLVFLHCQRSLEPGEVIQWQMRFVFQKLVLSNPVAKEEVLKGVGIIQGTPED